VKAGSSSQVPLKNAADPVRGMDFNYEDLSLRFIYWKNVKMLDADARITAARIKCWLIRVNAPDVSGPYYTVDLWVHKDSGGMAKMEAYDRRGKMVKRFEVRKMQKVDGATALKEMMVESLNQTSGDVKGRTYMTLDAPVKQN
jgi:negative regulator of sigma E activity